MITTLHNFCRLSFGQLDLRVLTVASIDSSTSCVNTQQHLPPLYDALSQILLKTLLLLSVSGASVALCFKIIFQIQVLVVCLESKVIKARHRLLVLRFMVSKVIEDSREQLGRLGLRAHLETMEFQDYQVRISLFALCLYYDC